MSRRNIVLIAIAAVAVAALVVGALLTRGSQPSPPSSSPARAASKPTSQTASGLPGTGTAKVTTKQGASAPSGGATSTPGGATPLVTNPSTKLAAVTTPPQKTVAMIARSSAATGTQIDIVFVPYGTGPGGSSIVANLTSVKVVKGTPPKLPLQGRNVLLFPTSAAAKTVATGGTYSGKVITAEQGNAVVLQLESAKRK